MRGGSAKQWLTEAASHRLGSGDFPQFFNTIAILSDVSLLVSKDIKNF